MRISGSHYQAIHSALLSGFDFSSLRRMVLVQLDQRLDDFARPGNLREVVSQLMEWAEQTGHLDLLLDGACAENPANAELQHVRVQSRLEGWFAAEKASGPAADQAVGHRQLVFTALPELPGDLKELVQVNRQGELDLLITHFRQERVATIVGIGGIGKTTLARTLLELHPRGTLAPLWVDFYADPGIGLGDLLSVFAQHLSHLDLLEYLESGRKPDRSDVLLLLRLLSQQPPFWVVFDNLESALDEQSRFADPELGALLTLFVNSDIPTCVILTTRELPQIRDRSLLGSVLEKPTLELAGLPLAAATELCSAYGRSQPERDLLPTIIHRVGGHPLALRYLASEAEIWGWAALVQDTALLQEGLLSFSDRLFSRLSLAEQKVLGALFVFRHPHSIHALMQLVGGDVEARPAVRRLIDKGLLVAQTLDRVPNYRLHPLIQELVAATISADAKRAANQAACRFYLQQARLPEASWRSGSDIGDLLEAHHHALDAGDIGQAAGILLDYSLPEHFRNWGEEARLIHLAKQTFVDQSYDLDLYLSQVGYTTLVNPTYPAPLRAVLYGQLGLLARAADHYAEALRLFRKGIALLSALAAPFEQIFLYKEAAMTLIALGDYEEAYAVCQQAADIAELSPTHVRLRDQAGLLNNAAIALVYLQRFDEALEKAQAAHQGFWAAGLPMHAHEVLDNIGVALYEQSRFAESLEYHSAALAYFTQIGNQVAQAGASVNLGSSLHALHRHDEARELYEQALKLFAAAAERRGIVATRINLGELFLDTGDPALAMPQLEAALLDSEFLGERAYRPYIHYLLGRAHFLLDAPLRAWASLAESRRFAEMVQNQSIVQMVDTLLTEQLA